MFQVVVWKIGRKNKFLFAHTFRLEQAAIDYARCYKPEFDYHAIIISLH